MNHPDCIFCKIVEGTIPSTRVFENESVMAFVDLMPHASKHYLFIHKNHTTDINDMMENDPDQVKSVFKAIADYSKQSGLDQKGFRVVTNLGPHAGQTVFHTHFHLVGGEQLGRFGR
ncbi:MAG TPA: HIT domain-containing protein [Bacteriovoracaceae bacterium]|nr:HIT domain-containing protein [Bacteriovoracaceae bacterium]